MSQLVENDNGDVLRWDGKAWAPAQVVENDKGERRAFDGSSWVPVSTKGFKSMQPAPRGVGAGIRDAAASVGHGLFQGAGDEIGAGIAATIDPLVGKWPGKSWGERYDAALGNVRGNLRAFQGNNPIAATALEVGGAIAGASALPAAGAVKAAPSLVGRLLQAGGWGAGMGGVSGFLSGEGGLGNRLESGATGAVIGGIAAPALTAAGNGIAYGARRAGMIADSPEQRTAKILGRALERDGVDEAGLMANVQRMNAAGVPATAVDAGGENVKALARAAASVPGKGREAVTQAVTSRTERLFGAADDTLLKAFNPEDFVTRRDKLVENISKNARAAYGEAFNAGKALEPDKELNAILNTPAVRKAWGAAYQLQKDFGNKLGVHDPSGPLVKPSTEFLHSLKMQLDDMAGGAPLNNVTRKPGAEGVAYQSIARRLSNWIKQNNPAYADAAAQYADDAGRIEALRLGSEQFFKLRPEELAAKVKEMGPAEKELFLTGVYDGFVTKGYNVLRARDHMATERFEERVRAVLPKDMATRMLDRIEELRKFQATTNFVAPRANSQTFARAIDMEDAGTTGLDAAISTGRQAINGQWLGAALTAAGNVAQSAANKAKGLDEETAAMIVKMLMDDPKASSQLWRGSAQALTTAADKAARDRMLAHILATGVPTGGVTATQGR